MGVIHKFNKSCQLNFITEMSPEICINKSSFTGIRFPEVLEYILLKFISTNSTKDYVKIVLVIIIE